MSSKSFMPAGIMKTAQAVLPSCGIRFWGGFIKVVGLGWGAYYNKFFKEYKFRFKSFDLFLNIYFKIRSLITNLHPIRMFKFILSLWCYHKKIRISR